MSDIAEIIKSRISANSYDTMRAGWLPLRPFGNGWGFTVKGVALMVPPRWIVPNNTFGTWV